MTEPTLPRATDIEVRRLLAAARVREPMPAEVVTRLDGVLAELGRAPTDDILPDDVLPDDVPPDDVPPDEVITGVAPVVDIRRGRRRLAGGLLAAAATVVAAVAVGSAVRDGGDEAGSATESAVVADAPAAGGAESNGSEPGGSEPGGSEPGGSEPGAGQDDSAASSDLQPSPESATTAVVTVRPGRFRLDAIRAAPLAVGTDARTQLSGTCPGLPEAARGVQVDYAGQPAALLYRPAARPDRQRALLYSCTTGQLIRRVTIPR